MKKTFKKKEVIVDVMEEEYKSDLSCGFKEDEVMKPGRHKFKRGEFLSRHGITPSSTKVRITIDIDLDILNYFKLRALEAEAASYETEINNILRELIEIKKNFSSSVFPLEVEALLADKRFIEAVARRVKNDSFICENTEAGVGNMEQS